MKNQLPKYRTVGLDTNIFVYYFNSKSTYYPFAEYIFQILLSQETRLITSVITKIELLSFKAPELAVNKLEKELFLVPNLFLLELTQQIANKAAWIRRTYRIDLADSIQLATAISAGAQVFITNDKSLKKFKAIKILLLNEIKG